MLSERSKRVYKSMLTRQTLTAQWKKDKNPQFFFILKHQSYNNNCDKCEFVLTFHLLSFILKFLFTWAKLKLCWLMFLISLNMLTFVIKYVYDNTLRYKSYSVKQYVFKTNYIICELLSFFLKGVTFWNSSKRLKYEMSLESMIS